MPNPRTCGPCNHDCNQGRRCPARPAGTPFDLIAFLRGLVARALHALR